MTNADGQNQFAVACYDEDAVYQNGSIVQVGGVLDSNFGFTNGNGHSGRVIGHAGTATGIVVPGGVYSNSGNFAVAGIDPGSGDFVIDAYQPDGTTDTNFGSSGEVSSNFGSTTNSLDSLNVADSNGTIEISGANSSQCQSDIGLAEYSFS